MSSLNRLDMCGKKYGRRRKGIHSVREEEEDREVTDLKLTLLNTGEHTQDTSFNQTRTHCNIAWLKILARLDLVEQPNTPSTAIDRTIATRFRHRVGVGHAGTDERMGARSMHALTRRMGRTAATHGARTLLGSGPLRRSKEPREPSHGRKQAVELTDFVVVAAGPQFA